MTGLDLSLEQERSSSLEPCLKLKKPTHRSPVLPLAAHATDGNGHLSGRGSSPLHGCEDGSDALASTDAHADQCILPTTAAQFVRRLRRQDAACRADGMTKRDPTPIR